MIVQGRGAGGVLMVAAAALVVTAGCGAPGANADDAAGAATAFLHALSTGDATHACRLLSPRAREELESEAMASCPQALAALPPANGHGHGHIETKVYGRQARVVFPDDTLFLADFPEGWRVTAALCLPRPGDDQPYDCEIQA